MILNTQLEYKGDMFPSTVIDYKKDVDVLHFSTSNNVILQLTVLRDSVLRFRYTTVGKFENDFSYAKRVAKDFDVHLNVIDVDESLLGGLLVETDGVHIDTSVKNHIKKLEQTIRA